MAQVFQNDNFHETVLQYIAIFFNFLPTSSHLRPLQVKTCDRNSRLVVEEDYNGNSDLKGLNSHN